VAELPLRAPRDVDVEAGGVAPKVERRVGTDDLITAEMVFRAIARGEREAIVEALRLDRMLVDAHQVELAVEDLHRLRRQRRAFHRADDATRTLRIGNEPVDIVDDHRQREAAAMALLLAAPGRRLVRQCDRARHVAGHALGELDACRARRLAALGRRNEKRRVVALRVGKFPAAVLGEMDHRPLGERGDRQQRIDAQRSRDNRSIAHVEPLEHGIRWCVGGSVEHLALVIDGALRTVAPHHASAQRMHGDEVVAQHRLRKGIADVVAAGRERRLAQVPFHLLEDRLLRHLRPGELQPAVIERHAPVAIVMAHHEIRLRAVDGPLIGAEQQALAPPRTFREEVDDAAVGILAQLVAADGEQRRQDWRERGRDRALLDHHAILEPIGVAQVYEAGDARAHRTCLRHRRLTDADAVHRHVVVVGERQHVAVSGEAFAHLIGNGEPRLTGAQQDLG